MNYFVAFVLGAIFGTLFGNFVYCLDYMKDEEDEYDEFNM